MFEIVLEVIGEARPRRRRIPAANVATELATITTALGDRLTRLAAIRLT